jgi:hypothetical protein
MERNVALLPVGTLFNGKRNKTIDDVISVWGNRECTVQVMDRVRSRTWGRDDQPATTVFVVGSGEPKEYSVELTAKHDQNGAYLGHYTQYGCVHIKDGKVVSKVVVKGRKIPDAAPVQVYK